MSGTRIALALGLVFVSAAAQGDYYTWKCEDGVPHRGSIVPNDAVDCGYEQYGDDGTLKHREPSLKEKREREPQEEEAEAKHRKAEEHAKRDQRWLLLYGSAAEAEALRDRRIEGVHAKIEALREQRARAQLGLQKARENARDAERQGRDVPPAVYNNIDKLDGRAADIETQIEQRQREIEDIRAEFEKIIQRLKELTGE